MTAKHLLPTGLALLFLTACASTPPAPQVNEDGLLLTERDGIDSLYVREDLDLSGYSAVLLQPPSVEFRKFWLRDANAGRTTLQTRVRPEDMEKARTELSQLFVERFTRTLELAGYEVTATSGDGVLELMPAIIELDLFAVNLSYRQSTFVQTFNGPQTGQMTLIMELVDAPSEATLARATDMQVVRRIGVLEVGDSVIDPSSNTHTLDRWARKLVDALRDDGFRGSSKA